MKKSIFLALFLLVSMRQVAVPVMYKGIAIHVADGDTFTSLTTLGFEVYKDVNIRLAKINAPELSSKDSVVRAAAISSRNYLASRILNKTIYFIPRSYDKYHRSIADVFLDPSSTAKSINQEMVDKGLAKAVKY